MDVSLALESRFTCRAFLRTPVAESQVREILSGAARTPSGGNLQPWRVWALAGRRLRDLCNDVTGRLSNGEFAELPMEFMLYPPLMGEPYAERRTRSGELMYDAIGVTRDDGPGQFAQLVRNFRFFDAPVGLFFAIDRSMQQGQWAEVGMYMQSVMLLAREHGLHTAPLAAWAMWRNTVARHLALPDTLMLFCGMALGHADLTHPINNIRQPRAPLETFAELGGF
jgi:nitroreductase